MLKLVMTWEKQYIKKKLESKCNTRENWVLRHQTKLREHVKNSWVEICDLRRLFLTSDLRYL